MSANDATFKTSSVVELTDGSVVVVPTIRLVRFTSSWIDNHHLWPNESEQMVFNERSVEVKCKILCIDTEKQCKIFAKHYLESKYVSNHFPGDSLQNDVDELKRIVIALQKKSENQEKIINNLQKTVNEQNILMKQVSALIEPNSPGKFFLIGRSRHMVSLRDTVECFSFKPQCSGFLNLAERVIGEQFNIKKSFRELDETTQNSINDLCAYFVIVWLAQEYQENPKPSDIQKAYVDLHARIIGTFNNNKYRKKTTETSSDTTTFTKTAKRSKRKVQRFADLSKHIQDVFNQTEPIFSENILQSYDAVDGIQSENDDDITIGDQNSTDNEDSDDKSAINDLNADHYFQEITNPSSQSIGIDSVQFDDDSLNDTVDLVDQEFTPVNNNNNKKTRRSYKRKHRQ